MTATPKEPSTRRRFPRAGLNVKVHLSVGEGKDRSFEATLPSRDISVSGVFFESTFFLKIGQEVDVSFRLPPQNRQVRARGRVVRVEQMEEGPKPRTGFAVRFESYYDSSEVVLANYFLAPALREFIEAYARRTRLRLRDEEMAQVVDIMSAWELEKMNEPSDVLWKEQP